MATRSLAGFAAPALASLAIVSAMTASSPDADPSGQGLRTVKGGEPVELCLEAGGQAARGLAAGKQRPVLALMSYDPPPSGRSVIEVTSSATGATSRIGVFPGGAFSATDPNDAQRFFLPSAGGELAATECFTISLGASEGTATIMLEISPPFTD